MACSVMGEDGSYGGSPCVDIHMNDVNIDLAGLTILEDANITLVCCHDGLCACICSLFFPLPASLDICSLILRLCC